MNGLVESGKRDELVTFMEITNKIGGPSYMSLYNKIYEILNNI